MKKHFCNLVCTCCLLFLMSLQAHAQRICFSDTTNQWRVRRGGEMGPDGLSTSYTYGFYASDTLVERNGQLYTEIKAEYDWVNRYFQRALVRDDTAAGLVYMKPQIGLSGIYRVTDTNEFVYMNYNLNLGDTLVMPLVFRYSDDSISIHVVTAVDSFMIGGNWYRKLELYAYRGMSGGNAPGHTRYTVYEGIGPESGPILEPNSINEYGPPSLYCFGNRGVIPDMFHQACFDPVSIEEPKKGVKYFLFYPNPLYSKLTVKDLAQSGKFYTVKILDLRGKVILESKFKHEALIDVRHLTNGIYILQIINDKVVVQSDKLIVWK